MPRKIPVAVVVDSAASLPADVLGKPDLCVVPMRLDFDGVAYLDGVDITTTEFYEKLRNSPRLPTTSSPSPASYLKAFEEASKSALSVLCITVSSRFSSSLDSARTAAKEAETCIPGLRICVLDSRNAAGGQGLVALEAWRAAQRGNSLKEVNDTASKVIARVKLLAFVDTLYYLWKGGRVPKIAHAGASLLRIKPLFELVDGDVNNIARPRTRNGAIRRLVSLMRERVTPGKVHATVIHANALEAAKTIQASVASEFDCAELFISEFTPVMGAHIGPGLLGVAFWTEGV